MEKIADVVIKFLDLLEAQFAEFRGKAWKLLMAVGLLLLVGVLAIAGFAMLVLGVYLVLSEWMPKFVAAFLNALLLFLMGGGLLLWAKKKMS